jgi:hypothetical protein
MSQEAYENTNVVNAILGSHLGKMDLFKIKAIEYNRS